MKYLLKEFDISMGLLITVLFSTNDEMGSLGKFDCDLLIIFHVALDLLSDFFL